MTREELEKRVHEFAVQIYKEGFEDGSTDVKMRVEGAYEKGLDDAWECARKIELGIVKGGIHAADLYEIFGTRSADEILESVSINDAVQKIKKYEERLKESEKGVVLKPPKYNTNSSTKADYESLYTYIDKCSICDHIERCYRTINECKNKFRPKHDCKYCNHEFLSVVGGTYYECKEGIEDHFELKKTDTTDIEIKVGDEARK